MPVNCVARMLVIVTTSSTDMLFYYNIHYYYRRKKEQIRRDEMEWNETRVLAGQQAAAARSVISFFYRTRCSY